jgi:anti-sigma B factor antagonist
VAARHPVFEKGGAMDGASAIALDCCPHCGHPQSILAAARDRECPRCGKTLWFLHHSARGVTVLTFLPAGKSGRESTQRLDEVRSLVGDAPRVVADLSQMQFLSSLFLGMLVMLYRRAQAAGGGMKIVGINEANSEILGRTKLDQIFELFADESTALASFCEA